jgi:hypothetical protein
MQPTGTTLVESLRDRVGPALRAVAHHEADSLDVAYLRDDLRASTGTPRRTPSPTTWP